MNRSWNELARFYRDAFERVQPGDTRLEALAELCRTVAESHLAESLFGHTSMYTLCISQTATSYPPHHTIHWLKIQPIADDELEFEYDDTPIEGKRWRRRAKPSELLDRLNRFLRQVGWSYEPIPSPEL